MATIRLRKQPHVQQQKFIDCSAPEQLYGGAKRGGKSVALCMKLIMLSVLFPGNRLGLFRKDFTDLQDTTLNEFWQICPPELLDTSYGNGTGHHKGERCIRLKTIDPNITSDILYRGLGGPEDIEKAKGLNLGGFGVDEPSEIDFGVYKMLRAQLTWVLPNGSRPPYMCLLASNPEPGWVKERFIETPAAGCVFIPALPRQNPFLPDGWENELRDSYDPEWVEKYLDGSWEVTEGSVFPELDGRLHALPPNLVDSKDMRLVAAIDHATTGITACVICGIDHNRNIFTLAEYYVKDKLISEHAREILRLMAEFTPEVQSPNVRKRFEYILIDPSTTAKTQQGGNSQLKSVADLYREQGLPVTSAWNALEAGLQRIKEMLHVNPRHVHPTTGTLGASHLYILKKRCPSLWKEMKDLKKEILPSGTMRFVGSDHALDCLRYIINSQPRAPKPTEYDMAHLPTQDRFAIRAHDRWAKTFGQKPNERSWF